ncbi:MAG: HlyC/CorC family transporter [Chlamydiae bacterium]|nr:HlyC/CorC family transporter [Chlamydiota bacterium]
MDNSLLFFLLTILCIIMQAIFAMFEMASVSFNKIRLQYYVSKNNKRAKLLNSLLNNPSQLFGTTLISINLFLQLGSEFSRRFYFSIGINPDFAPISQIFIVLIFAELSPLFAARRYSENVALAFVPLIYYVSFIFKPLIALFNGLAWVFKFIFKEKEAPTYLSKDELQKVFEEKTKAYSAKTENIDDVINHIFSIKNKTAKDLMIGLDERRLISSKATLQEMKNVLSLNYSPFIPIYHNNLQNIVAVAYPKDLLQAEKNERVLSYAKAPWFVSEKSPIITLLKQFKQNKQSLAICLDSMGKASGILIFDQIIDAVFGEYETFYEFDKINVQSIIEKTIDADILVSEFNQEFHAHLKAKKGKTLNDLIIKNLGHLPAEGEVIRVASFEITVLEVSIFGAKVVAIKSVN